MLVASVIVAVIITTTAVAVVITIAAVAVIITTTAVAVVIVIIIFKHYLANPCPSLQKTAASE
jgi:hypothetical protein